jgi:hypothetical protein
MGAIIHIFANTMQIDVWSAMTKYCGQKLHVYLAILIDLNNNVA